MIYLNIILDRIFYGFKFLITHMSNFRPNPKSQMSNVGQREIVIYLLITHFLASSEAITPEFQNCEVSLMLSVP